MSNLVKTLIGKNKSRTDWENNLKRYKIEFSKNFLKVQMVMAMNQGLGLILCKNNNIEMINSIIREMFHLDLID